MKATQTRPFLPLLGTILVSFSTALWAGALGTSISLHRTGTNSDGDPEYALEWPALSNRLYRVQQRDGFDSNSTWTSIDVSMPTGPNGKFKFTPDKSEANADSVKRKFFRLQVPQPEIFSVQPAVLGTNGGTIYILGQELDTNGMLRIGGVPMPVIVIDPGSLYRVTVPPLGEDTYDIEWVSGGTVVATLGKLFSVTGQPTPVGEASNEQYRLQEPPEEMPASPAQIIAPAALKVKEKGNRTKCTSNLRISPANGECVIVEEDLRVEGRGMDFVWTRTYRSRNGIDTPTGQNWDHSYNIRITPISGNKVVLFGGSSQSRTYYLGSNGVYSAHECFEEGTFSNGVFTLIFAEGGKWIFTSISNAVAPGMISRIEDRTGNALQCGYDASGRLNQVVDTLNRTNRIQYFPGSSRVLSITDHIGRQTVYSYYQPGEPGGSPGDLKTVRSPLVIGTPTGNDFPNGKITTYMYSSGFADERLNHNLTSVVDPKGQPWLNVEYGTDPASASFDRVVVSHCGANPPTVYTYLPQTPSPSNSFAVMKTIINDPVGNVSICSFDSLNRKIVHRDLAARAVPGTPLTEATLPTVKLRDSDPDFWETRFSWNVDSFCTKLRLPAGNSQEFVYEGDLNPNVSPRHRGDLRVMREVACCTAGDLDGDGLPLTLATRYTYDPRFGSPARFAAGPRQSTSLDGSYSHGKFIPTGNGVAINTKGTGAEKGRIAPVTGQVAINTKGTGADKNRVANNPVYEAPVNESENPLYGRNSFVTQVIDPRGVADTFEYDAQGNRVLIAHSGYLLDSSDKPVSNFEFNSHGQLTAIVAPADANGYRRRTELDYFNSGSQNGYLRTFTVDAQGPIVTVTTYDYDDRGNVTVEVDPRGNTNRWVYNALDQAVIGFSPQECAACSSLRTAYIYDANDNLVRVDADAHDHTGAPDPVKPTWTTFYRYDELDRCTLIGHELAHTVQQGAVQSRFATNRFVYDPIGNIIEKHSPEDVNGNQPGNYVAYQYDTRNFLWTQTEGPFTAVQSTTVFNYDFNGNVKTISHGTEDPTPATYTYDYDGFDRRVRATDAMGNTTECVYDRNDNLVYARTDGEVTDVPGNAGNQRLSEVRLQYDSLNRITQRIESFFDVFTELPVLDGSSTTVYSYAPNGACRSITDDNGHTTSYSYDTLGRCVAIADPKQNTVTCTYDLNGNIVSLAQNDRSDVGGTVQGFVTTYQYDALDRCTLDFDNVGNTNLYSYDSLGNLTRHTDPRGVLQTFDYDGACRRLQAWVDRNGDGTMSPNELTSRVVYDDNGNVTSSSDANTNTTRYAYDALNRCVATTHADGTSESLIWSPRSNLSMRTDPNGTTIHYSYDAADRCVRRDITTAAGVAATTTFETFTYDGVSRLMSASNDVSRIDYRYDSLGNCVRRVQDGLATDYTYDGVGNRMTMHYPSGREVAYEYDAADQVTAVRTCEGCGNPWLGDIMANFAYEGSRLSRLSRTNGINTRIFFNGDNKAPNAAGDFGWRQVSQINHQRSGGGVTIDRRGMAYDRAQNKLSRTQLVPWVSGTSSTTNTWNYDALSQLRLAIKTKGTSAQLYEYELDNEGNRVSTTLDGVAGVYTMDSTLPEPADFQMNQYSSTPFGSRVRDHNGNVISVPGPTGSTDFSYDYANRLVSVARNVGPATTPVVSYSYDALGHRISKTTYPPAPSLPAVTVFIAKGDEDCDGKSDDTEEYENGTLRKTIVFPHVLEVSGRISFTAGAPTTFTICDELGTALALTDSNGTVLERYDYDDFGLPHFLTSDGVEMTDSKTGLPLTASPNGNRYLFRGMEWESETALYVDDRRWDQDPYSEDVLRCYDPRTAEYYQNPQTEKRSSFAENNPWTSSAKIGGKQKLWQCANFRLMSGGHGGGGGGGCGGISIDEPGVHLAVMFNPKEYTIGKMEGGRHTPFHNRYKYVTPRNSDYWGGGDDCDDNDPAAYEQGVMTARESGSGMATGRSANIYAMYSIQKGCRTREAGSGMATGRRTHILPHVLETSGKIQSAREQGSGMATGRYNFFEAWPCRWKAPELNAMAMSGKKEFKGHVTLLK